MPQPFRLLVFLPILSLLSLLSLASAHGSGSQRSHGIIGYGINMYKPVCGFACHHVLSQSRLNCSVPPVTDRWHGGSGLRFDTSPECFASDHAFLLSMAWCLQQHCGAKDGEEQWAIERYWEEYLVGSGIILKYTFSRALKMCGEGLKSVLVAGKPLEVPSEVAVDDWAVAQTSMRDFALNEGQHSTYALLLLLTMIFIPLVLTLIAFLASATSTKAERFLLAYLIYPHILRKRHLIIRLLGGSQPPTCGQALLIFFIVVLNGVFSIIGYHGSLPNIYWTSSINMTFDILANRVGILAFANLPIIFIYSSRNNPLIRLTGWSYTTYVYLHRWVAYICIAEAVLHSIVYFIIHIPVLSHKFTQSYWNVGIFGTTASCLILPASLLFVRRKWYKLFIDVHVTLALSILLACYYHIYFKFEHDWGYENWILLAALLWALERLARGFRIATNGLRTAKVLEVDDEYFVIDIEGVKGVGMAHLYFPTLGWRVWENHPFSVMASVVEARSKTVENTIEQGEPLFGLVGSGTESGSEFDSDSDSDSESGSKSADEAQQVASGYKLHKQQKSKTWQGSEQLPIPLTPITPDSTTLIMGPSPKEDEEQEHLDIRRSKMVLGLSFLIRRERGTTARLFTDSLKLRVFVEGPYSSHLSLAGLPTIVPHLVCIAGGVGIAPILPLLRARATALTGSTRLYFGTRSRGLLSTCGLEDLQRATTNLDIQVRIGERWDMKELVWREAGCYEPGSCGNGADTFIIVCGPASLSEDVRWAVVEANRRCKRGIVRLLDESFG